MRNTLSTIEQDIFAKSRLDDLRFVIDSIRSPILVLDCGGRVAGFNQAAKAIIHLSDEAIQGQPIERLIPQKLWANVAEQISRTWYDHDEVFLESVDETDGKVWEFTIRALPHSEQGRHTLLIANDITRFKQTGHTTQTQSEYLTAINEISLGLMNRLDTHDILRIIIERVCAILKTTDAFICLIDSDGREMMLSVGVGKMSGYVGVCFKPHEGLPGQVWQTCEPVVVNGFCPWPAHTSTDQHDKFHSMAGVPLKSDAYVMGVLGLASQDIERQIGADEIEALTNFAMLASIALDNAQMYRAMRQELTERNRAEDAQRDSEENYRLLFESNPLPLWVYDRQTLSFLAVNDAAVRHYGYSREEFLSMTTKELQYPGSTGELLLKFSKAIPELTNTGSWKHRKKDGEVIDVEIVSHEILFGGRQASLALMNDVTERKHAEETLQKREEHFRSLIENASDLILILNGHGTLSYLSPSAERELGYSQVELVGRNVYEFVHPEDFSSAFSAITHTIQTPGGSQPIELRIRPKNGPWRTYEAISKCITNDSGEQNIIVNARDITERKAAEQQLQHDALHDPLTNLPNRLVFMDRLGQAIRRAKRRSGYLFAVLFVDLDHFKLVNDSLGHIAGDHLLIAMARRLVKSLRPGDTIARIGGDEFTILLEDIEDASAAVEITQRIQDEISIPFNLEEQPVYVSSSIGIAIGPEGYDWPEEILRDADTALYQAKGLGKSCHVIFDANMRAEAIRLLQLRTDLSQALERDEFRLYYQPIVSLETSRIEGFEALVRWQHPKYGLSAPGQFIAVAEETNLINPLGMWVLGEACRQASHWQALHPKEPPLFVSVNLSVKQLAQTGIVDQIGQILDETGFDPQSLKLEITESIFMTNPESTVLILLQLKELGVKLVIDDFGTGYSSLSYLHKFPFDMLKIDRAFVSSMNTNKKNAEIVRTIVLFAHSLGMTVIAEGIETVEQLSELKALRCEQGQGYHFSKPVEGSTAATLIASQYNAISSKTLPETENDPLGPPNSLDASSEVIATDIRHGRLVFNTGSLRPVGECI